MHIEKFKPSQIGNMLKHFDRNADNPNVNRRYGNQEIKKERSHLNYNLVPAHGMSDKEYIAHRLAEIKNTNKRKDRIEMVSCVATLPKDYKGDEKTFFKESYNFLADRYGMNNVISAWVHQDETTPHLHFAFVPIIERKGKSRLCARDVITKKDLSTLHNDCEQYLNERLHEPVRLLNGATTNGNKSMREYKQQAYMREIEAIERETEQLREHEEATGIINKYKSAYERECRSHEKTRAELYRTKERATRLSTAHALDKDVIRQYDNIYNDPQMLRERADQLDRADTYDRQEHNREYEHSRDRA